MRNYKTKKAFGFVFFLALLALGTLAVMLLWNALLPTIFGIMAINYWQALGLLVLARILFGRMPGHHFGGGFRHHHKQFHQDRMQMYREMQGMSREERIEFIRKRMHEDGKKPE